MGLQPWTTESKMALWKVALWETDATKRSTLAIEEQWQRLTPEQLTSRVMADTVLLRWLTSQKGVYRLVRACNQDSSYPIIQPWKAQSSRSVKTLSGVTSPKRSLTQVKAVYVACFHRLPTSIR